MKKIFIVIIAFVFTEIPGRADDRAMILSFPSRIDSGPVADPASGHRDLLFDQAPVFKADYYHCQWDSIAPFWAKVADNFNVPFAANVDSLVWWGGYWSGLPMPPVDFRIEIYPDSTGNDRPRQNPIYSQRVGYVEVLVSDPDFYYCYKTAITPFLAQPGLDYWIVFQPTLVYPPYWGNNGSTPPNWGDGQQCFFKSDQLGYPLWTPASAIWGQEIEIGFQIYGRAVGVEETPYPSRLPLCFGFSPNMEKISKGRARIVYIMEDAGRVTLEIYDRSGRRVRILVDHYESTGEKTVYWDGRDQARRLVEEGIYFLRLATEEGHASERLIFFR